MYEVLEGLVGTSVFRSKNSKFSSDYINQVPVLDKRCGGNKYKLVLDCSQAQERRSLHSFKQISYFVNPKVYKRY